MTHIEGQRPDAPADNRTTAEALKENMRLINRVLFELATEHPDNDELPETHRRIIQQHAESLFKTNWVSRLAGAYAIAGTFDVADIDAAILAALEAKPGTQAKLTAELTILTQARQFGYVGDDSERARVFIDHYIKQHPNAAAFVGAPVEVVDMGGE